jgi:hypothetical protein
VPLEGWARIPQTKRHSLILEQAKGSGDGCLLHVLWIDWDLVVPLPQVDLGENSAAIQLPEFGSDGRPVCDDVVDDIMADRQ